MRANKAFFSDISLTAVVAGFLAVVVSFAGSSVIIFQAAKLAGLSQELTSSWIWAVSIGSGVTGLILSWRMKVPVVTAWSTPGAALLVVMLPSIPYAEAIAAYITSAVIITIIGITGSLDLIMRKVPAGVSAGLFAGILFNFGARVFTVIEVSPVLACGMIAVFLLFRRTAPRYSVLAVMLAGIVLAMLTGELGMKSFKLAVTAPVFTAPAWSGSTVLALGLPLALVTLTGQYISGMAVLHTSGYRVQSNGIMAVTGIFSILLAPFGSHAINLSSITAAICTGREAHENPDKRYVAGVFSGLFYLIIGVFGATITVLFASLPEAFIAVLAGLALIGAFSAGITGIVHDAENLEAGIITFLATASGIELLGLGPAFWGLCFGGAAWLVLRKK